MGVWARAGTSVDWSYMRKWTAVLKAVIFSSAPPQVKQHQDVCWYLHLARWLRASDRQVYIISSPLSYLPHSSLLRSNEISWDLIVRQTSSWELCPSEAERRDIDCYPITYIVMAVSGKDSIALRVAAPDQTRLLSFLPVRLATGLAVGFEAAWK